MCLIYQPHGNLLLNHPLFSYFLFFRVFCLKITRLTTSDATLTAGKISSKINACLQSKCTTFCRMRFMGWNIVECRQNRICSMRVCVREGEQDAGDIQSTAVRIPLHTHMAFAGSVKNLWWFGWVEWTRVCTSLQNIERMQNVYRITLECFRTDESESLSFDRVRLRLLRLLLPMRSDDLTEKERKKTENGNRLTVLGWIIQVFYGMPWIKDSGYSIAKFDSLHFSCVHPAKCNYIVGR